MTARTNNSTDDRGFTRALSVVVREARLEEASSGLSPVTHGWFAVNVRDAAWETNDALGAACFFEGDDAPFAQYGINLRVLFPRRTKYLYHAESNQEDFLVLAGECLLLIEDEERRLRAWDFVHCPPGTAHAFVAVGDGPCVVLMVGARSGGWPEKGITYPRSVFALRHGVGVQTATDSPEQALAAFPPWQRGRPAEWTGLPWA
jgi:uncharacterized cupin superfamily protein